MISSVLGSRTTALTVVEPTSTPTTTARVIFFGSAAAPFGSFSLTVPMGGPSSFGSGATSLARRAERSRDPTPEAPPPATDWPVSGQGVHPSPGQGKNGNSLQESNLLLHRPMFQA